MNSEQEILQMLERLRVAEFLRALQERAIRSAHRVSNPNCIAPGVRGAGQENQR
jgi:hypothetical protein